MKSHSEKPIVERRNPWIRLGLLAAVLLALVVYYWGPNIIFRLSAKPAPSAPFVMPPELAYAFPPPIHDIENGFVTLKHACALVPEKPQGFEFETSWRLVLDGEWLPNAAIQNYLERLSPARELASRALAQPQWLCPPVRWGTEHPFGSAQLQLQLVLLMQGVAADAKRLLAEEQVDKAYANAQILVGVGQRLQAAHGGLAEFVLGCVIEGLGYSVLAQVMESPKLSTEKLQEIAAGLVDNEVAIQRWQTALKVSFHTVLRDEIDSAPANRAPLPERFFDRNETKRALAADYLLELRNATVPFSARDRSLERKIHAMHTEARWLNYDITRYREAGRVSWRLLRTRNPFGRYLEYAAAPVAERTEFEVLRRHRLFLANAVPTLGALLAYNRQYSELPASLEVLVENKMLRNLPVDPFDLKPLRYSKQKRRLWSVAMDCVDQGGDVDASSSSSLSSFGDFVIRIPK